MHSAWGGQDASSFDLREILRWLGLLHTMVAARLATDPTHNLESVQASRQPPDQVVLRAPPVQHGAHGCCPRSLPHNPEPSKAAARSGAPPVQHGAQDLGGHDDAARAGVDAHVARHEAHVAKLLGQLAELLVAQRLRMRTEKVSCQWLCRICPAARCGHTRSMHTPALPDTAHEIHKSMHMLLTGPTLDGRLDADAPTPAAESQRNRA